MKRLKWAGYGNKGSKVSDVKAGELMVFCPACPQPSINIPENWKDDPARYVTHSLHGLKYLMFFRWVYKHIFVADGNFNADHVRQKNSSGDIWLSEGGGMIPNQEEYHAFLKTAIERLTVCFKSWLVYLFLMQLASSGITFTRRHPVQINFRLL
jgi:hypothetical protein